MNRHKILVKNNYAKSSWNPPKGDPNLDYFLGRVEEELFTVIERPVRHSNLSQEEWKTKRSLADDRNVVIKNADKGSCVVIWDRNDDITEAENQLSDKVVYKQVSFKEKSLCDLVEISNRFFRCLKWDGHISEKEMKYFMYEYKNVNQFEKVISFNLKLTRGYTMYQEDLSFKLRYTYGKSF